VNVDHTLPKSILLQILSELGSIESPAIEPLMREATIEYGCSSIRRCWEDEFYMWEVLLECFWI
jgi:hypothetical protein